MMRRAYGSTRRIIGNPQHYRRPILTTALGAIGGAIALAGCTGNPSLTVPVEPLSSEGTFATPNSDGAAQATLVVEPRRAACEDPVSDVYVATVAWRIEGSPPAPVTIRIDAADGTVFAEVSAFTGQAVTGSWVTPDMEFYAVDASGRVLANISAPERPC